MRLGCWCCSFRHTGKLYNFFVVEELGRWGGEEEEDREYNLIGCVMVSAGPRRKTSPVVNDVLRHELDVDMCWEIWPFFSFSKDNKRSILMNRSSSSLSRHIAALINYICFYDHSNNKKNER